MKTYLDQLKRENAVIDAIAATLSQTPRQARMLAYDRANVGIPRGELLIVCSGRRGHSLNQSLTFIPVFAGAG